MKDKYSLFAAFVVASLLLGGCFDQVSGPLEGPDRVGFAQLNGAGTGVATPPVQVPDQAGTIPVPAQLVAAQRNNSFNVQLGIERDTVLREREITQGDGSDTKVTDVRALPTTADDGDFSVPDSFTFPADSSNMEVPVEIQDAFPASAPSDTTARLTIRMETGENSGIEVAKNFQHFRILIVNQ